MHEKFMRFNAAGAVLLGIGWIVTGAIGTTDWVHVGIGITWMAGGLCYWVGALRRRRRRQRQRSAVS